MNFEELGGALGKGLATVGTLSKDATRQIGQGTQKVLVKPTKAVVQQTNQVAVQPLQKAVEGVAQKMAGATAALVGTNRSERVSSAAEEVVVVVSDEMALPPDEQLQSMDILYTKQLANTSPNDWFNNFWKDAVVYEEFWQAAGKQDIVISEWQQQVEDGAAIQNPYDNEDYTHRRTVSFRFTKTIMGRSLTPETTTLEHCRLSADRCVATASTEAAGVPFGDAFLVQLRWVGTRVGTNDLMLQLGLYVLFRKSVLVAGQIRSASREESLATQLELFETMKKACGAQESTVQVGVEEDLGQDVVRLDRCIKPPMNLLRSCIPRAPEQIFTDDLDREVFEVREMLHTLAESALVDEQRAMIRAALATVNDALDEILVRKLGLEDATTKKTEDGTKSSEFRTSMVKSMTSSFEEMNSVFIRRISKVKRRAKGLNLSKLLVSSVAGSTKDGNDASDEPADPAFDKGLQSMNVVVSKFLENATMSELNDLLLKRSKKSGREPLYETWLRESGLLEIKIGEWEEKNNGDGIVDPWSKESYQRKRIVSFQSPRSTNSFLAQLNPPASLDVKQTQYFRLDASKLVLATTEESSGAPFSNSVKVYRRLVVSQVEERKISFKCGIFVLFSRPVLVASKIYASETQETRRMYTALYRLTRASLDGESVKKSLQERFEFKDVEEDEPSCFIGLIEELRRLFRDSSALLVHEDSEFKDFIRTIRGKLGIIDDMLEDRKANSMEDLNFYSGELVIAREALDSVLVPTL